MKNLKLVFLCLILSLTIQEYSFKKIDDTTIVYAVENQVFAKELNGRSIPRELVKFKGFVTGLAMFNDHLYVSVKRPESNSEKENSFIWRVQKLFDANKCFELNKTSEETFHELNAVPADILSMTIANGFIYAGRSDGRVWRCSANKAHSCEDFENLNERKKITLIGDIEYNPWDRHIYLIRSSKDKGPFGDSWAHEMVRCSTETAYSCDQNPSPLKSWATLYMALNALWIADAGLIRKCLFDRSHKYSVFNFKDCVESYRLNETSSMNIGVSSKYLYARFESTEHFWQCDPMDKFCSVIADVAVPKNMGPFIFACRRNGRK